MNILILQVKFSWSNSATFGKSSSVIVINHEAGLSVNESYIKKLIKDKAKSSSVYDNDFEVTKIDEIKTYETKEPFVFIGGF